MATFARLWAGAALGASTGRRDIMSRRVTTGDPREDIKTKVQRCGRIRNMVLFCGRARRCLSYLKRIRTCISLSEGARERLKKEVNEFARKNNMPFCLMGLESAVIARFLETTANCARWSKTPMRQAEKLLAYYMRGTAFSCLTCMSSSSRPPTTPKTSQR